MSVEMMHNALGPMPQAMDVPTFLMLSFSSFLLCVNGSAVNIPRATLWDNCSQSIVPGSGASASLRNLLEMQTL